MDKIEYENLSERNHYSGYVKERRRWLQYFVFVAFFLPAVDFSAYSTIFNSFIPNPLGYKMTALILSFPLIRRFNLSNTRIRPVYWAVIIACIYQLFIFFSTVFAMGVYETLTIFRHSFIQCLHLCILIPFILQMDSDDVDYVLKLMIRYIIVLSCIYIVDCLFLHVLPIMARGSISVESHGGVFVERSIIGFPPIIGGWTYYFFAQSMNRKRNAMLLLLLCLFSIFISFTRGSFLVTIAGCLIVSFLFSIKNLVYINHITRFICIIGLFGFCLVLLYPQSLTFWEEKLNNTFNKELKKDQGTYAFRERLIEKSQDAINNNPVTGKGYVRDVKKGKYSMVLGGDTYIAPVLWCEGYCGLILRVLPYILILLVSIRRYLSSDEVDEIDVTIIAFVLSSMVGYVQTPAIVAYPLTLMILLLLKQKQYYDEQIEDFDNHSIV